MNKTLFILGKLTLFIGNSLQGAGRGWKQEGGNPLVSSFDFQFLLKSLVLERGGGEGEEVLGSYLSCLSLFGVSMERFSCRDSDRERWGSLKKG